MSVAEILIQIEKLSDEERAGLIRVLREAEAQDDQQMPEAQGDQEMSATEDEKPFKTIFDIAPHLVGAVDSGITDLGSNKKHMEGYGTKEGEREAY